MFQRTRGRLLIAVFCLLLWGAESLLPPTLVVDSCRGHPFAAFQHTLLTSTPLSVRIPNESSLSRRKSASGLSTLSAVLAPPSSPWRSFRVPTVKFPKLSFFLPQLPTLEQDGTYPYQATKHSADLSSEMVLQLYFGKLGASASDSRTVSQLHFDQSPENAIPASQAARSGSKIASELRIPGIDLRENKHLADNKSLGREAELKTASTADGKGGRGASLQLLESLGLSADDAFCDMCRTLKLMGVVHRLDFTTHEGKVFPDVVLTDFRDNARLVLHLDALEGDSTAPASTSRISKKKGGKPSEGQRMKEDAEYLHFKREAMSRAGYEVLLLSESKWLGLQTHSDRVALLATVLANKGFW